jgi:hypothetical protein
MPKGADQLNPRLLLVCSVNFTVETNIGAVNNINKKQKTKNEKRKTKNEKRKTKNERRKTKEKK